MGVPGEEVLLAARRSQTQFSHKPTTTTNHYSEAPPAEGEPAPGGLTDADLESNWDEAIETFDGMELPEELLRGIYSYGFEKPSAIQQRAIKPAMMGRDLIAQAQSGTVRSGICSFLFVCLVSKEGRVYCKYTIFRV